MRARNRLVPLSLKDLPAGMHGDGGGLYLRVTATGARSWVFRFMLAGQAREMGLGAARDVKLAEARKRAAECRVLRDRGIDPIDEQVKKRRQNGPPAPCFAECAERYIATHEAAWRNPKHIAQWRATIATYALPVFGSTPVGDVDVGDVLKVLEPIWQQKPETASRLRGRIEAILDWAKARGYRDGDNPARWRGHCQILLPRPGALRQVRHHAALPYAAICDFVAELREEEGIAARALEFLILTAARTGEVIGARWSEISLAERLWTVPAERMKSGREHRVPLSTAAIAILDKLQRIPREFVFPGARPGRPLSNMAFSMLLRRMAGQNEKWGHATTHGFRSSFRDWAAEETDFPAEVAEMALAHVVGNKVEAAYRRGDLFDKRRQLMDAWSAWCETPAPAGQAAPPGASIAAPAPA